MQICVVVIVVVVLTFLCVATSLPLHGYFTYIKIDNVVERKV